MGCLLAEDGITDGVSKKTRLLLGLEDMYVWICCSHTTFWAPSWTPQGRDQASSRRLGTRMPDLHAQEAAQIRDLMYRYTIARSKSLPRATFRVADSSSVLEFDRILCRVFQSVRCMDVDLGRRDILVP